MTEPACPFCSVDAVLENELAYARLDRHPVTPGHLLIIPRRHVQDWFGLDEAERRAIDELIHRARDWLAESRAPDGFNIGMNCGQAAGQTVFHMHCHLVPRYSGDSEDPRGGVRWIMPSKAQYWIEE